MSNSGKYDEEVIEIEEAPTKHEKFGDFKFLTPEVEDRIKEVLAIHEKMYKIYENANVELQALQDNTPQSRYAEATSEPNYYNKFASHLEHLQTIMARERNLAIAMQLWNDLSDDHKVEQMQLILDLYEIWETITSADHHRTGIRRSLPDIDPTPFDELRASKVAEFKAKFPLLLKPSYAGMVINNGHLPFTKAGWTVDKLDCDYLL